MTNSPLRLEGYFFSRIEMQAHADGDPEADPELKTVSELGKDPDDGRYLVTVRVEISRAEEKKNPPYTGMVEVRGFFRTAEGYPTERCDEMVYVNGSTMLYGAVREMLLTVTTRGPWPGVMLPSVRFTNDRSETAPVDQPTSVALENPELSANVLPPSPKSEVDKARAASTIARGRKR